MTVAFDSRDLRFLALGDSYTLCEGVPHNASWPVQLANLLRGLLVPVGDPVIVAQTGWTTAELAAALDANPPAGTFDLVSVLIGVNNQYRGLPVDVYREELASLVARAIVFAAGDPRRVLVLSIPDWGVTPFARGRDTARIREEIDAFNDANRAVSARAGVRYVHITAVSRSAAFHARMTADDGLHPSGVHYAQWVELVLPAALNAVRAR